jgi:hypothetical protein
MIIFEKENISIEIENSELDYGLIYGLILQLKFIYIFFYYKNEDNIFPFFKIIKINETTYKIEEYEIIKLIKNKLFNNSIYLEELPYKLNNNYDDDSDFKIDYIFSNFLYSIHQLNIFSNEEFEKLSEVLYKEYNENSASYRELYQLYLTNAWTGKQLINKYDKPPTNLFKKINLKNNNEIECYDYNNELYIIENNKPIKVKKEIVYFVKYDETGDRFGNKLFGFFKSLVYTCKELIHFDNKELKHLYNIKYIFFYNEDDYFEKRSYELLDKHIFNKDYDNVKIREITYLRNLRSITNKNDFNNLYDYYAHDILCILLDSKNIESKNIKTFFYDFINKNTKVLKIRTTQSDDLIKISLHYRLSDFCAGNTDDTFFNEYKKNINTNVIRDQFECYNNSTKVNDEGKKFYILSFIYYMNIINKIISQNQNKEFKIIIYYLKTKIDDIIIYLLIEYIQKNIDEKIKVYFDTEYSYYEENNYNELDLIYNASKNDVVILSNSTFGFWMIFFKILSDYTDKDTEIKSIYYGKYLNYSNITGYLYIDKMLENNVLIESNLLKFNENCSIDDSNIYYFHCLELDMIRIFLIILYFKLKYKINIDNIDEQFINQHKEYNILTSHCFHFIKYYYTLYKDYKDPTSLDSSNLDVKFDILGYSQLLKKIINYNDSLEELNIIIKYMSDIFLTIQKSKEKYRHYTKYLKYKKKYNIIKNREIY